MLFKNENLNDEIVDILQEVHDSYIPKKEVVLEGGETVTEVLEPLFFGGDQLTEERARNAQDARGDGDSYFERLEGLIPKVEDWHAIRLVYQVDDYYYCCPHVFSSTIQYKVITGFFIMSDFSY